MASELSYTQSQHVVTALEAASKLSFQLAEALRIAEEAIIIDNEITGNDLKLNMGTIQSVRGSHWLAESAIITERKAWEGYAQARGNNIV